MKVLPPIIISLFFILSPEINAQVIRDSVPWSQLKLKDGLYLDYLQFRQNKPVPRSQIISSYDSTRLDFLRTATSARTVKYKDAAGKQQEVNSASLWGFCENGSVYLRYNGEFNKIIITGSLCHFTSLFTSYVTTGPTMSGPTYGTPVQSTRQYIFDAEKGNIYDYTLPNIEMLLQRDPELYAEFMKLRKNQRKKMMFIYLRKYNDKHPVYFNK